MRRPFQIRVYASGGFFVAIDLDDFTALVKIHNSGTPYAASGLHRNCCKRLNYSASENHALGVDRVARPRLFVLEVVSLILLLRAAHRNKPNFQAC